MSATTFRELTGVRHPGTTFNAHPQNRAQFTKFSNSLNNKPIHVHGNNHYVSKPDNSNTHSISTMVNGEKLNINLHINVDNQGIATANATQGYGQYIGNQAPMLRNRQIIGPSQFIRTRPPNMGGPIQVGDRRPIQVRPTMGQSPSVQSRTDSLFKPQILEDKVYCIVCEKNYSANDREQHVKKHIRPKESRINSIIGNYDFQTQPIRRPIIEPEEFNVQYNPNKYIVSQDVQFETTGKKKSYKNNQMVDTQDIQNKGNIKDSRMNQSAMSSKKPSDSVLIGSAEGSRARDQPKFLLDQHKEKSGHQSSQPQNVQLSQDESSYRHHTGKNGFQVPRSMHSPEMYPKGDGGAPAPAPVASLRDSHESNNPSLVIFPGGDRIYRSTLVSDQYSNPGANYHASMYNRETLNSVDPQAGQRVSTGRISSVMPSQHRQKVNLRDEMYEQQMLNNQVNYRQSSKTVRNYDFNDYSYIAPAALTGAAVYNADEPTDLAPFSYIQQPEGSNHFYARQSSSQAIQRSSNTVPSQPREKIHLEDEMYEDHRLDNQVNYRQSSKAARNYESSDYSYIAPTHYPNEPVDTWNKDPLQTPQQPVNSSRINQSHLSSNNENRPYQIYDQPIIDLHSSHQGSNIHNSNQESNIHNSDRQYNELRSESFGQQQPSRQPVPTESHLNLGLSTQPKLEDMADPNQYPLQMQEQSSGAQKKKRLVKAAIQGFE